MKRLRNHPFIVFQLGLLALVFVVIVFSVSACESESGTEPDPACGSGRLTWDSKAEVCRDDVNNTIVPSNCCNR